VNPQHGPTAGRRKLRAALRQARESAALTQDQVAADMDWSLSKLIRIETGRVSISTNDLKALLTLYGITEAGHRDPLVDLARVARQKPWWQDYRDAIPVEYAQFIGLEAEAESIRVFQPTVVPGLLQTESYARAIFSGRAAGQFTDQHAEDRARVRLRRQEEVLHGPSAPSISVILDEAVLRRSPSDETVLRDQLSQLVELGSLPHVTIRILPFGVGVFSPSGHFTILSFPDPDDNDVVYLESVVANVFIDTALDTRKYLAEYDRLARRALSPAESLTYIKKVAGEL
jgi:transcriptional regulator with XRE-family HTH domain